jgi:hypothetical protein
MTRVSGGSANVGWAEEREPLRLSESQRIALAALEEFANAVDIRGVGSYMVRASAAVLAATVPDCPEAPSGAAVSEQWSYYRPYRLVWRCAHDPAHCWDGAGNPTTC